MFNRDYHENCDNNTTVATTYVYVTIATITLPMTPQLLIIIILRVSLLFCKVIIPYQIYRLEKGVQEKRACKGEA